MIPLWRECKQSAECTHMLRFNPILLSSPLLSPSLFLISFFIYFSFLNRFHLGMFLCLCPVSFFSFRFCAGESRWRERENCAHKHTGWIADTRVSTIFRCSVPSTSSVLCHAPPFPAPRSSNMLHLLSLSSTSRSLQLQQFFLYFWCLFQLNFLRYMVMKGYWNNEAKTKEAIDDEHWMHTGDLAVIDDEGFCSIVGRIKVCCVCLFVVTLPTFVFFLYVFSRSSLQFLFLFFALVKDCIIRGGENIFPREVEEFLYTHPDIGTPCCCHVVLSCCCFSWWFALFYY